MRIGVPREIKNHEYRVGLTPASVQELVGHGHVVLVESGAGDAIGYDDASYRQAGAQLVACEQVFSDSDLIVKVKEPQAEERQRLRPGQTLFTYGWSEVVVYFWLTSAPADFKSGKSIKNAQITRLFLRF